MDRLTVLTIPDALLSTLSVSPRVASEARAWTFAAEHHAGQVRNFTGQPYIVHPAGVVRIVRSVPHTPAMILAAWLHDAPEDTKATVEQIRRLFGDEVADLVAMVTNPKKPPGLTRAERKAIDRAHVAQATPQGQTLKLADILDNCGELLAQSPEFARQYFPEKILMLDVLREGDSTLWHKAHRLLTRGVAQLDEMTA